MAEWKAKLLDAIRQIEGVQDKPSPVSGGTALTFGGKEFAHFHNDNEIDLRLTKKVIQSLGLCHPTDCLQHPNRSPNSPWIALRLHDATDVAKVADLIRRAAAVTAPPTRPYRRNL